MPAPRSHDGSDNHRAQQDNVVNISAERLVDALFKQLKQLFPAAEQTNLKTAQQETDAKRQWIAAFAEGGIRTREQVSAGMRHARACESPFWPSPCQFIKWCKDSKMVLGVSIEDVMGSFTATPRRKAYSTADQNNSRGATLSCTGLCAIPCARCTSVS